MRLEKLQYICARACTGALPHTNNILLLQELSWSKLSDRRNNRKLVFVYKCTHNLVPSYLSDILPPKVENITGRNLRSSHKFRSTKCKTTKFQKSLLQSSINSWNQLNETTKNSANLNSFKGALNLPKKTPYYYYIGKRIPNLLHTRLRLNTSKLNGHLFRSNLIESPACTCGYHDEGTKHFILYCPHYTKVRQKLLRSIANLISPGVHPSTLPNLEAMRYIDILLYGLSLDTNCHVNIKIFHCFQTYILESGRFTLGAM